MAKYISVNCQCTETMAVFRSKVSKAVATSTSVRTTIPEAVAAILGAEPGSILIWEVEPGSGRVQVAVDRRRKA